MIVGGYILLLVGCIACLVGEVLMLKFAYNRGFGWFLACLVLGPLCWLALLGLHFKSTAMPFALAVSGILLAGVGRSMAGLE